MKIQIAYFSNVVPLTNDRFFVAGGGLSSGVILQRFPELNWDDTPFHEGIEWVRHWNVVTYWYRKYKSLR